MQTHNYHEAEQAIRNAAEVAFLKGAPLGKTIAIEPGNGRRYVLSLAKCESGAVVATVLKPICDLGAASWLAPHNGHLYHRPQGSDRHTDRDTLALLHDCLRWVDDRPSAEWARLRGEEVNPPWCNVAVDCPAICRRWALDADLAPIKQVIFRTFGPQSQAYTLLAFDGRTGRTLRGSRIYGESVEALQEAGIDQSRKGLTRRR